MPIDLGTLEAKVVLDDSDFIAGVNGAVDATDKLGNAAKETASDVDSLNDKVKDTAGSTREGTKETKSFTSGMADLKSGIDLAIGTIQTFGETFSKVIEFGEAGAQINQTRASFDTLGISLDDLRGAVNGTVDDMTLMSSTLTLTAGASDEMQAAFLAAAPQLLEIAKAANKLNPELGDTAFQYESIATAAKRQSVQIADNLGIIIKQGAAYESYAQSIGKTVEELSAEEKQLAFLNALLESGNVLIDQAAKSSDAGADSFAKLGAATKNLGDEIKSQAAPALSTFAENLAAGVDGVRLAIKAYSMATDQYGLLAGSIAVAAKANGYNNTIIDRANDKTANLTDVLAKSHATLSDSAAVWDMYSDAQTQGTASTNYAAAAIQAMKDDTLSSSEAFNMYNSALIAAEQSAAATAAANNALAAAELAAREQAALATAAFNDSAAALGEMTKAQLVSTQLDVLSQKMAEGAISAEEFTAAQTALLTQSGLLTDAEIGAQSAISALIGAFADGKIGADTLATGVLNAKDALDAMNGTTVSVNFDYNIPDLPNLPNAKPGSGQTAAAFSEGGSFIVPPGYPNDTFPMRVESGEMVTVVPRDQVQTTQNYFNMTVNTRATTPTVTQDFLTARALLGN